MQVSNAASIPTCFRHLEQAGIVNNRSCVSTSLLIAADRMAADRTHMSRSGPSLLMPGERLIGSLPTPPGGASSAECIAHLNHDLQCYWASDPWVSSCDSDRDPLPLCPKKYSTSSDLYHSCRYHPCQNI